MVVDAGEREQGADCQDRSLPPLARIGSFGILTTEKIAGWSGGISNRMSSVNHCEQLKESSRSAAEAP